MIDLTHEPAAPSADDGPPVPERAQRARWHHVELPEADPAAVAGLAGRRVLVADDHGGVAGALAALLHAAGAGVEVVDASTPPSDAHHAALGEADTFVWLAALDHGTAEHPSSADARAAFAWWQPALLGATDALLVATPGGGTFAGPGLGLGAMAKTIARELPGVAARTVDVHAGTAPELLAATLAAELADLVAASGSAPVEVAYHDGRRATRVPVVEPVGAPPEAGAAARLALDADSVVLLTGGARGITALTAVEIARRHGSRIELVGRTPLPGEAEDPRTASATDRPALRRALIDAGTGTSPAEVEAECTRLLAAREVRATLAALADAGVEARYHQVDVTDAGALAATLHAVARHHGRLDLVVHGAGVLDDRSIRDKTADGFGRVFATKVDAARTILEHTGERTTVVLFGSVSGAFGNRGQVDYSAANAALDELAATAHRTGPGRVLTVDWGPWAGTGMVSPELEREYARRGIGLVDPADGVAALLDELAAPAGPPQVMVMRASPAAMAPELARWSPALDGILG